MLTALFHLGTAFFRAACLRRRAWRALEIPDAVRVNALEKRRFYHYYFGTTYLAVLFAAVLRRRRSARERRLFIRLAALAAFFDDLSERSATTGHADLEAYGRLTDPRGLAWHFLQNIRRELTLEQTPAFENELKKVFESETGAGLRSDQESVLWHTGDKGGHSVLLFRALLIPSPDEKERAFLMAFGRLIQLCDDIFDVWFDARNPAARSTLPVFFIEENNVTGLMRVFEHQVAKTRQLALETGKEGAKQAWATVFFLVALTRFALRHYQSLKLRYPNMPLHDRRAMVVDMGRWRNRWGVIREILRKTDVPEDLS